MNILCSNMSTVCYWPIFKENTRKSIKGMRLIIVVVQMSQTTVTMQYSSITVPHFLVLLL